MAPDLRIIVKALSRLNPWIAALLVAALLQYQQVSLRPSFADQISSQPISTLLATPKVAVAKPAPPETQARLIPLLDAIRVAAPPYHPDARRLASIPARATMPTRPSHGWQARAPPVLLVSVLTESVLR